MTVVPSTTSWLRLEPRSRDAEMADGLQARVHDPLWFLARQWQVGELTAHDGGSPVAVRCRVTGSPLTQLRRRDEDPPVGVGHVPLEVVVEAERESGRPGVREAVETGLHLLRLLRGAGLHADAAALVDRFPLGAGDEPDGPDAADGVRGFVALAAGRVPDGRRVRDAVAALPHDDVGPTQPIDDPAPSDPPRVLAVLREWWRWSESAVPGSGRAPAAWVPDRLEHRFTAQFDGHPVTFGAPGYRGGDLDWYDLDVVDDGDQDQVGPVREVVRTAVPSPVRYRGMPRSRWWELEDARSGLSTTEVAREDLATLLFLEFTIARGDDWSVVPLDLDVGAVHRVRSLVVSDTFGRPTLVPSAREVDGPGSRWRLFAHTGAPDGLEGAALLVPTVLPTVVHGPVLEELLLRRDELANMAWAVERVVEDGLGRPVRRRWRGSVAGGDSLGTPDGEATSDLVLRLSTPVPENWVPLVPVRDGPDGDVALRVGRMHAGSPPAPQGVLLRELTDVRVPEEEVPRAGVRLTRRWQWARSADGEVHLWTARRAATGGGESWSGLRFDALGPSPGH